jgi:hypothetical protein
MVIEAGMSRDKDLYVVMVFLLGRRWKGKRAQIFKKGKGDKLVPSSETAMPFFRAEISLPHYLLKVLLLNNVSLGLSFFNLRSLGDTLHSKLHILLILIVPKILTYSASNPCQSLSN